MKITLCQNCGRWPGHKYFYLSYTRMIQIYFECSKCELITYKYNSCDGVQTNGINEVMYNKVSVAIDEFY